MSDKSAKIPGTSDSVSLPPELPENASKSDIPSSSNVIKTEEAKFLDITIANVKAETFGLTTEVNPFMDLAAGVILRCLKAGVNPLVTQIEFVQLKIQLGIFGSYLEAVNSIAAYFYTIYLQLAKGETSLPYHPRNIGFILNALARNRVLTRGGFNTLFLLSSKDSIPDITLLSERIANLFKLRELGYDVVNVPVYESGPFQSSKADDPKAPVEHVKLNLKDIGSTYISYHDTDLKICIINNHASEEVSNGTWFIKALCGFPDTHWNTTFPMPPIQATWSNIAVTPRVLRMYASYMDILSDVPYIISTVQPYDHVLADYPEATVTWIYDYWVGIKEIITDNGLGLSGGLLDADPLIRDRITFIMVSLLGYMYSPLGGFIGDIIALNQDMNAAFDNFAYVVNIKDPIYYPSILQEAIATTGEVTTLKTTNHGISRAVTYFHFALWPFTVDQAGGKPVAVTITAIENARKTWEWLLIHRRFIKMNAALEYKNNKALLPNFFMHTPITVPRMDAGKIIDIYTDALVTPYAEKYIQDHNLHLIGRLMLWPIVFQCPPTVLDWLTVVDLIEYPSQPPPSYAPILQTADLAYFSVDAAYSPDASEIDAYLSKMRAMHLGFFAALAGLLPGAIKGGISLVKSILSPDPSPKAAEPPAPALATPQRIEEANYASMAQAGVSSLQQSMPGLPGSGGTVDLSKLVHPDPVEKMFESGIKAFTGKKTKSVLRIGAKAYKIGKAIYQNR